MSIQVMCRAKGLITANLKVNISQLKFTTLLSEMRINAPRFLHPLVSISSYSLEQVRAEFSLFFAS